MAQNKDYERFFMILENTPAQKYLRANPFTRTDGVDFGGILTKKMFFDSFYAESRKSSELLEEVAREVKESPESIIILQGYSGCGKTTFLNYLLNRDFPHSSIVDFERGIDNTHSDPIRKKIQYNICDGIFDDMINQEFKTMRCFVKLFFDYFDNFHVISHSLDTEFQMHKSVCKIEEIMQNRGNYFVKGEKSYRYLLESINACLDSLNATQILTFYVLWDIASDIAFDKRVGNLFCFDNLDNVDVDKTKEFIKYFAQFWINLVDVFYNLKLPPKFRVELSQRYGFILSLRETTYARLTEHLNDLAKGVFREFTVSDIYSLQNIISKRKSFLSGNKGLSERCPDLYHDVSVLDRWMRNEYIEKNVVPLFNHSYNISVMTLCQISQKDWNRSYIDEYNLLEARKNKKFFRGANAVILKMIFEYFKEKEFFEKNLQLYDFGADAGQKYLFSPARLILTYLSNLRYQCSFYQMVKMFENIIDPKDIADILDKLYLLRYSSWRHLITFDKNPPSDRSGLQRQLDWYNNHLPEGDSRYCTFEITPAGKVFLKTMASHFEFYSTRLSRGRVRPLFLKYNLEFDAFTSQYRFQTIINRVYRAVLECCNRLKTADESICQIKGWTLDDFYSSDLVFSDPKRNTRQFHGERLIFNHIGYINIYRQYLLSMDAEHPKKVEWNRILVDFISDYLGIYERGDCTKSSLNVRVAKILREQIDKIKETDYHDFETPIETEDYKKKFF